MITISYCTTCKGRLWQLKQTLGVNLKAIRGLKGVDLVLLDYHSEDGMKDWVFNNFLDDINSEKLKYYRLKEDKYFDMSFAKNIAHNLASSDILFNLDADNFIGTTVNELFLLKENEILISHPTFIRETNSWGRWGRIGIYAKQFHELRGYDEDIEGMGCDDGNFILRASRKRIRLQYSNDTSQPIPNTAQDKIVNCNPVTKHYQPMLLKDHVNQLGYGCAESIRIRY